MAIEDGQNTVHGETALPVMEERVSIARRVVETGRVRVHVLTETEERRVESELRSKDVSVERVPIGRELRAGEPPPATREEDGGAVLVVPVLEEVLVVEKRLLLKEELRIRRCVSTETVGTTVTLRRQQAHIERMAPVDPGLPAAPTGKANAP